MCCRLETVRQLILLHSGHAAAGPVFGTPSRILQPVTPQLPVLTATIAGGAAATAAPAEAAQTPGATLTASGGSGSRVGSGAADSQVSDCCKAYTAAKWMS